MARIIWLLSTTLALSSTAVATTDATMNITFSPPDTKDCGTKDSTNAISFTLLNTPTTTHCFNLNSTFTNPNTTTSGFTYTLSSTAFNYHQNYSQISFSQPSNTNLTLKTYNGLDCVQVAESDGLLEPWTSWTCDESELTSKCSTLPYSVRSYEIGPLSTEEEGSGKGCVLAAAYGKESGDGGGRRVGVAGGLVIGVALGVAVIMGW